MQNTGIKNWTYQAIRVIIKKNELLNFHSNDAGIMLKATAEMSRYPELRKAPRSTELPIPMVEIKFPGSPTYQLKIHDTADEGVGVVVRPDSKLLNLIEAGQVLEVRLISPTELYCQGQPFLYQSRIEHITEVREGPFRGHMLVGMSLLNKIKFDDF